MAITDKVFLDTNVLVYQFDHTSKPKQKRAIQLVERGISDTRAVISSQVVQEFMNVALKKFAKKPSVSELEQMMTGMLEPLCAHFPSFDFYERALKLYASDSLSFYDSLIVQAAMDLDCTTLYSEDLQNGRMYGALKIKNPFA